jgi:preprotein translocase subunit SecG
METVIIVIHLMVIVALVAVVLLQRSEGGALGIGGSDAFLTTRGQGNVLTRATTILGIAFFLTSIAMTVYSQFQAPPSSILDTVPATTPAAPTTPSPTPFQNPTTTPSAPSTTTPSAGGGILDQLNQYTGQAPAAGGQAPSTNGVPGLGGPAGEPDVTAPTTPQTPTAPTTSQTPAAPTTPQVPTGQ